MPPCFSCFQNKESTKTLLNRRLNTENWDTFLQRSLRNQSVIWSFWTRQASQASQCLFKHPALVGSLDKWALWNFAKVLWQLYSSQDTASWSVTVAPWSPGLLVAVTATAWSWERCTGGADSWHHMGGHRSHVRMNSVRLVYFNIWLICLMSCMFLLCLSKCHKIYLKIRYPCRWWSS